VTESQYKKLEMQFAQALGLWFRRRWVRLTNTFLRVLRGGRQRFTLMLIPRSERRIYNVQISFFSIVFFAILICVVLSAFVLLAAHLGTMNKNLYAVSQKLNQSDVALENLKDQISTLRGAERGFRASVRSVRLALEDREAFPTTNAVAISSLYPAESPSDLAYLKNTTGLVDRSAGTLRGIGKVLGTYKEFLEDTPTLWPLKGKQGVITTRFGWTINPFTRLGYLHLGVDIAWGMGTPIVAAANGVVIQTGYTDESGNFVAIQHKYGFMTRYFHMVRIAAHLGAYVHQGDVIGYLGTTGLSTGPHVHYEVHLGNQYVDPMNFLSIPPDLDMPKPQGMASD
jgi:murein DD-endopeptidase MepM/ murein hydrolase activator NlpD